MYNKELKKILFLGTYASLPSIKSPKSPSCVTFQETFICGKNDIALTSSSQLLSMMSMVPNPASFSKSKLKMLHSFQHVTHTNTNLSPK